MVDVTKIIAALLADTHLEEDSLEIIYKLFEQAADRCKEMGLDFIIHLGDIFDSRKGQSQDVLTTFNRILDMLQAKGVLLITFPGNHDKTSYTKEDSFLDPYKHHPALVLIKSYYMFQPEDARFRFHMIPFFADEMYREYLKNASATIVKTPGIVDILFTHVGVTGAKMNNGKEVEGISPLDFIAFDKVFIGHYHDKQILGDKFVYIGASLQHNFGETQEKGMCLLSSDLSIETLPLDFPRFITIEMPVTSITPKDIEDLKQYKDETKENIRVIITGEDKDIKAFNRKSLLDIGVAVLTKAEAIEKEEIDSRVEAFTPTTLIEEFEAFCKKNSLEVQNGIVYLNRILNG